VDHPRSQYAHLSEPYLAIAIVVAAVILVLVVFVALRFRDSRPGAPSRRAHAPLLEGAYVAVLAGVAAVLLVMTFRAEGKVDSISRPPGLRVDVTAARWNWRFDYPDNGVTAPGTDAHPSTLVVPAGTLVRFRVRSIDVVHAFWLPAERFKKDANPDRWNTFELVFHGPGRFEGACSEFCGLRHDDMRFNVEVLAPAAFRAWLRQKGGRP
jgi:cytochrome c oxidase subunit II